MKKVILITTLLIIVSNCHAQMDLLWQYHNYGAVFCQPMLNPSKPTGWGTGFIVNHKNKTYLITNYHNVSNKDVFGRLQHDKGEPNQMNVFLHWGGLGKYKMVTINLIGSGKHLYHKYISDGSIADVVAIEIEIPKECQYISVDTNLSIEAKIGSNLLYVGYPEFPTGMPLPLTGMGTRIENQEASNNLKMNTSIPYFLFDPTPVKGFSGSPVFYYDQSTKKLALQGIIALSVDYTTATNTRAYFGGYVPTAIINKLLSTLP